jgi:hypothetical protein
MRRGAQRACAYVAGVYGVPLPFAADQAASGAKW